MNELCHRTYSQVNYSGRIVGYAMRNIVTKQLVLGIYVHSGPWDWGEILCGSAELGITS